MLALARLEAASAAPLGAGGRVRAQCSPASVRHSPPYAPRTPTRRCFAALLAESRAALPAARELRIDRRDADLARPLADGLGVELTLDTWGGLELASDDGRTLRNTLEERLANAEPLLRRRFAELLTRV